LCHKQYKVTDNAFLIRLLSKFNRCSKLLYGNQHIVLM